jgi:hypothetical protein
MVKIGKSSLGNGTTISADLFYINGSHSIKLVIQKDDNFFVLGHLNKKALLKLTDKEIDKIFISGKILRMIFNVPKKTKNRRQRSC